MASSSIVIALRAASSIYTLTMVSLFGWLLLYPMPQEPSKFEAQSPSLFSFFSSLNSPPETMGKRPPPCVPPVRISSPSPLPPSKPSFGWLLCQTIEQRPFKTGAPPISKFFDERPIGAPNKGKKRSASAPGRRPPPSGSWGAAATRFGSMAGVSMEREGEAAGRY